MTTHVVDDFLYEDLTYKIRGAVFSVYNTLGSGHKELVYQKALAIELSKQDITFKEEPALPVVYDNVKVGTYRPDFLISDSIIVEIKALPCLLKRMERQLVNYLKGTGCKLGLLINFGSDRLEIRRKVWSNNQRISAINQR